MFQAMKSVSGWKGKDSSAIIEVSKHRSFSPDKDQNNTQKTTSEVSSKSLAIVSQPRGQIEQIRGQLRYQQREKIDDQNVPKSPYKEELEPGQHMIRDHSIQQDQKAEEDTRKDQSCKAEPHSEVESTTRRSKTDWIAVILF